MLQYLTCCKEIALLVFEVCSNAALRCHIAALGLKYKYP